MPDGKQASELGGITQERDPQVEDNLAQNAVSRWRGTNLTGGSITNLDNGNVGIGATNPVARLEVSGGSVGYLTAGVRLTNPYPGSRPFQLIPGIFGVSEAGFSVYDVMGSANRLVIDAAGNVGIGTPTPGYLLDVNGQARVREALTVTMGDIWMDANSTIKALAGRLTLQSGEHLILSPAGNVGVRTTTPGAWLDIGGAAGASLYSTLAIKQSGPGQKGIWLQANQNNNSISIHHDGSVAYIGSDSTGPSGWITPLALQMTGGNVGVGVPNPGEKLVVNGDAVVRGNMGIGTTPGYRLHVNSHAEVYSAVFQAADRNENVLVLEDSTGWGNRIEFANRAYGRIGLWTGGDDRLTVLQDGRVGVGTPAPADKLDVNGWARVHGLRINTGDYRIHADWTYCESDYPYGCYSPFLALKADDSMTVLVPPPGGFRITNYRGSPPPYGKNNLILRDEPDPYHDFHQLYLPYGRLAEFSDGRLKLNQEPLDYGLAEVMQLESIRYKGSDLKLTLQSGGQASQKEKRGSGIGFIAQEVYKVIPEAVAPPDEIRETWCLSYSTLIPVLVNAIQEQQEMIEEQEENNMALAEKIKSLEERITALERK